MQEPIVNLTVVKDRDTSSHNGSVWMIVVIIIAFAIGIVGLVITILTLDRVSTIRQAVTNDASPRGGPRGCCSSCESRRDQCIDVYKIRGE